MSVTALISNISRCSLHDGPGVRTVVYFMGCPLRCKWCHNPETQSSLARTVYNSSKCIGCGKCVGICPRHHIIGNGKLIFLADGCSACGKCAELCPARALTVIGEKMSVDEVFDELKKDIHYYGASGGGVTFSGGECLLYPDFVAALAKKCGDEGIHTVLESAFYVPWEHIETVLPFVDMFYVDLKIADHEKHKIYTGKDNRIIIDNLKKLSMTEKRTVVRIPVIPQVNDTDNDMTQFGRVISELGGAVRSVELLKYNYLAETKYRLIGKEYTSFAREAQTDEQMAKYRDMLSSKLSIPVVF